MSILEVAIIPVIVTCVYGIIEYLKVVWFNKKEEDKKYIPAIAAGLGAILGLIVYFIRPEMLPLEGWYGGIICGIVSGLSAVGVNQLGKQLGKDTSSDKESDTDKKE